MTPALIRFARLDARLAGDREGRAGVAEGLIGGVSPGAGAQGTKDGPLGVGPMPVLSEPLGSSISDHGSAGFPPCRPRDSGPPSAERQSGEPCLKSSSVQRAAVRSHRQACVSRPRTPSGCLPSRFDTRFSSWDGGRVGYRYRCCTSDKEVPSASGVVHNRTGPTIRLCTDSWLSARFGFRYAGFRHDSFAEIRPEKVGTQKVGTQKVGTR
jgi:hypothetical protein